MQHFLKGVNLGGWLSQYQHYSHEHFRTFITRSDIDRIADWGFDHIRLPVDYPVLEADDAVGIYREEGFQYIDNCLEWCRNSGLAVVFDLHHAPGYTFHNALQADTLHLNTLFSDAAAQQRFINLWSAIVHRYEDVVSVPIIFELLNEVVLPDSGPWNALARRTAAVLRDIAPHSTIMIGSNHNNAAAELQNIEIFDDPNICYTFHFYEPLLFTHQKASWVQEAVAYNQDLDYPGEFLNLREFVATAPQYREAYAWQTDRRLDRALMQEFLQPALDFADQTGRDLYCGEFGVIDYVSPASRRNWHADLLGLLRPHGIGWGVWSYKAMNFGLVDARGHVVDPVLLDILRRG